MLKKGELATEETIKTVLIIAGLIVLLLFANRLLTPNYNKVTAEKEGYLERFLTLQEEANIKGTATWDYLALNNENYYYLVYFGNEYITETPGIDAGLFTESNVEFSHKERGENIFCICNLKKETEKTTCNTCKSLEKPLQLTEPTKKIYKINPKLTVTITTTKEGEQQLTTT